MGFLTCTSFFVLQTFCVLLVSAHPQCLDYFPPFTSTNSQGLCKETAQYGCCTSTRDKSLQDLYDFAVENGRETEASASCKEFIRKIICAECNPYAAHIFDAETPPLIKSNYSKKSNRFPGLCYDFCLNSFEMCRKTVLRLPMNTLFRDFVQAATRQDFCKWAIPADKDYCLPQVNDFKFNSFTDKATENVKIMCVQPMMHSFFNPLAAVHANDGTNRLFVAEQRGVVFAIGSNGALVSNKPFLDMRERILNSGQAWDERGFLGLAFHPKYRNNGRFFVYYSFSEKDGTDNKANKTEKEETHWYDSPKHKIRISEFIVSSSSPSIADIDSEIVLLEVDEPEANHEGGMLLFGDDGYLYLFIGDGGGAGDRHWSIGNALNMTSLLGKILRIDVDVYDGRRYKIPPDNPFVGQKNVRPEIYAYGARNMWRCSKDRGDPKTKQGKGRIFCGDVGQNKFEEIDIIVSGGNYGWRAMEGNDCYDKTLCKSKVMTSVLTLTCIGVQKHAAVGFHKRSRFTRKVAWRCISAIWLVSVGFAFAPVFGWSHYAATKGGFQCGPFAYSTSGRVYGGFGALIWIVLPIMTMAYCYMKIYKKTMGHVRKMKKRVATLQSCETCESGRFDVLESRLIHTFIIIVITFAACWFPSVIRIALMFTNVKVPIAFEVFTLACAYGNSSMNPIIYAFRHKEFRIGFKSILKKAFGNCKLASNNQISDVVNRH